MDKYNIEQLEGLIESFKDNDVTIAFRIGDSGNAYLYIYGSLIMCGDQIDPTTGLPTFCVNAKDSMVAIRFLATDILNLTTENPTGPIILLK